jgi:hypothetical protein
MGFGDPIRIIRCSATEHHEADQVVAEILTTNRASATKFMTMPFCIAAITSRA